SDAPAESSDGVAVNRSVVVQKLLELGCEPAASWLLRLDPDAYNALARNVPAYLLHILVKARFDNEMREHEDDELKGRLEQERNLEWERINLDLERERERRRERQQIHREEEKERLLERRDAICRAIDAVHHLAKEDRNKLKTLFYRERLTLGS
ncbi:hypothetical protein HK405_008424, partial [Cladochytrium tenue]